MLFVIYRIFTYCLYFTVYLHTVCILQDIYILFVFYSIFTYCLAWYLHSVCILQYFYILLSMIFAFCLYSTEYLHTVCILQDIYILFSMIFTYSVCIWHAVISRFSGDLQGDLDLHVFIVMVAIFVLFHVVYLITIIVKVNIWRINILVVLEVNCLALIDDLSLLKLEQHQWYNGERARLDGCRSWVKL
jgi:hypothetical protein